MDIALSKIISFKELKTSICSFFETESVFIGDIKDIIENPTEVFITISDNESEFPFGISIDRYPRQIGSENFQQMAILLASYLAKYFKCQAICDGTGYGDDNSPYRSIIWDNATSYLADDCKTLFADGEGGKVKRERKLNLDLAKITEIIKSKN